MKILLATDGSEESELAARAAVELANSTGSELHLVHVKLLPVTLPYPEVLDWREDLERAEREKPPAHGRCFAGSGIIGSPGRDLLQSGEGLRLVHAGAPEQVHGHRADLAHEDADRQVMPHVERLCRAARR